MVHQESQCVDRQPRLGQVGRIPPQMKCCQLEQPHHVVLDDLGCRHRDELLLGLAQLRLHLGQLFGVERLAGARVDRKTRLGIDVECALDVAAAITGFAGMGGRRLAGALARNSMLTFGRPQRAHRQPLQVVSLRWPAPTPQRRRIDLCRRIGHAAVPPLASAVTLRPLQLEQAGSDPHRTARGRVLVPGSQTDAAWTRSVLWTSEYGHSTRK